MKPGTIFLKMKIRMVSAIIAFMLFLPGAFDLQAQPKPELWYGKPAVRWEEALPVGNGRLGAMVFGKSDREVIQLNEESIWAGSRINNNNPEALKRLKEIQKAIFRGSYDEAEKMAEAYMLGTPPRIRSYQPLGNLHIDYSWAAEVNDYRRSLDLRSGIATTAFSVGGKRFVQRVFASAPDNIIVVKMTSEPGALINASLYLARELDAVSEAVSDSSIVLTGQIVDKEDSLRGPGGAHMKFGSILRVKCEGGNVRKEKNSLVVSNALSVTVTLTAATNYNLEKLESDPAIDPLATCRQIL
nr:glycoside hydrolase family 95 protein [Bacteroidales bacterium]